MEAIPIESPYRAVSLRLQEKPYTEHRVCVYVYGKSRIPLPSVGLSIHALFPGATASVQPNRGWRQKPAPEKEMLRLKQVKEWGR
uniref:Uncharacterized protein n=1 Tax=Knipowitschia caucasica TaxID=637954 RepID=A0AAV2JF34_KNICA